MQLRHCPRRLRQSVLAIIDDQHGLQSMCSVGQRGMCGDAWVQIRPNYGTSGLWGFVDVGGRLRSLFNRTCSEAPWCSSDPCPVCHQNSVLHTSAASTARSQRGSTKPSSKTHGCSSTPSQNQDCRFWRHRRPVPRAAIVVQQGLLGDAWVQLRPWLGWFGCLNAMLDHFCVLPELGLQVRNSS